jgi:hypothetical protein
MSVRLAKNLCKNQRYEFLDVVKTYQNWFKGPPHDTEKAFDTGNTFNLVFTLLSKDDEELTEELVHSISKLVLDRTQR